MQPVIELPLIYPEIQSDLKNKYSNVLLIDKDSIKDYNVFVDSVNSDTFPIVYSGRSSSEKLLFLLRTLFTTISRIAVVFSSIENIPSMFLDETQLFAVDETEPFSKNVQFIIQVIREFRVKNVDFLACNTLNSTAWRQYYDTLHQQTGVVVGASDDKTGNIKYGGDWVMESTSQDIESIYFTKIIEYYSYLLDVFAAFQPVGLTITPDGIMFIGNNLALNGLGYAGSIQKINLSTPTQSDFYWASRLDGIDINGTWGLAVDNGYLYATNSNSHQITKISITNPKTDYTNSWVQLGGSTDGITIFNGFAYICCSVGAVVKVSLSNPSVINANWANSLQGVTSPSAICNDGTWIYVANYGSARICKISISDPQNDFSADIFPALTESALSGITILYNYLYIACSTGNKIARINLNDPTDYNVSWYSNVPYYPTGLAFYNNQFFVGALGGGSVISIPAPPPPPYPCFKQGSKILTFKGYKKVEDLRTGDLVKTLRDGFKPIVMIGKRYIKHLASKSRIKEQLYKCSREKYPDVFEDLVLTGCHSILVDAFVSEDQRATVGEVMKAIYITDDKYRLPACADERAFVYENPGTYTIYHLALEHDDYYMNYGIYANGLLVESCSKRYLKEESNMELI